MQVVHCYRGILSCRLTKQMFDERSYVLTYIKYMIVLGKHYCQPPRLSRALE
jgi:hypothetical protein